MIKLLQFIRNLNKWTHTAFLLIGEVSLGAMVVIVTSNVIMRYVFKTGIGWAEEVPRLLITLFAFLACAMGVRDHAHMSVGIVYNRLAKGGNGQKFLDFLTDFGILLCGLFMLYYGWSRCQRMMGLSGTLPMTGLRTWCQYLPIPLAGFLITFDSILFLTKILKPNDMLFTEPEPDYMHLIAEQGEAEE